MSATVAAAVKKIAIYILGDENKRGKLFVAVGSIIAGFLGLMFLPIAVISSIGSMNIEQEMMCRNRKQRLGELLYLRQQKVLDILTCQNKRGLFLTHTFHTVTNIFYRRHISEE